MLAFVLHCVVCMGLPDFRREFLHHGTSAFNMLICVARLASERSHQMVSAAQRSSVLAPGAGLRGWKAVGLGLYFRCLSGCEGEYLFPHSQAGVLGSP